MRHLLALSAAVLLLVGCSAAQPPVTSEPTSSSPATESATPEADTTVTALIISGSGLSTQNVAGDTLGSVKFTDGEASLAAFITMASGLEPEVSYIDFFCTVPYTMYSWDVSNGSNGAVSLHVSTEPNPPLLDTFVLSGSSSVNGVAIRTSAGFGIGDDISAIPATLPAEQTVGLHDNISVGGSPDPTSFVFDPVGEVDVNGVSRSYGGAVLAEAGVAQLIFSPRTTMSTSC
jgi:hypothetical protein